MKIVQQEGGVKFSQRAVDAENIEISYKVTYSAEHLKPSS